MSMPARSIERKFASLPSPLADDGVSPEIYRQLFVALNLSPDAHPVIGVTSAIRGEGRTTIAMGLARTLAHDLDSLVSLVDVDLEHPSLTTRFDLDVSLGLAEVIRGERHLEDVSVLVAPNLCIVPAGAPDVDTPGLLRQLPIEDPFHGPRGLGGVVILDLPPILNHAYSSVAAQVADAVVLVVRAGVTPADVVRDAIARLEDLPPAGIVFNGPRSALPSWWPGRDE